MLNNQNRYSDQMPFYMAFHEDGLIDIVIGVGLLLAAFGLVVDIFWIAAIYPALLVSLMPAFKQLITVPRISSLDLSRERLERIQRAKRIMLITLMVTMLLGVLAFALTTLTIFQNRDNWPFLAGGIAFILVAILAVIAYAYEIRRFYAYAALTALIIATAVLIQTPLPFVLIILGCIFLAFGLIVMARFLTEYPRH